MIIYAPTRIPGSMNWWMVDGGLIFPAIPSALPDLYEGIPPFREFPEAARHGVRPMAEIPHLDERIKGLETVRRIDLEGWMGRLGLDAVACAAVADVEVGYDFHTGSVTHGPVDLKVSRSSGADSTRSSDLFKDWLRRMGSHPTASIGAR
jgi:hypothetical protein